LFNTLSHNRTFGMCKNAGDTAVGVAQGSEMAGEGPRVGKVAVIAEEAQAAGIVRRRELLQEQAAEQP
jgi:hypothetical protein